MKTPTWQLSTLPRCPHPWRLTPTECVPRFGKLLGSKAMMPSGSPNRSTTSPTNHDLVGELFWGNVSCWHQDPQNVLTAVTLGKQLFDKLEQTLQRVTSYRPNLLSDGDSALCERKPFCFRP